MYFKQSCQTYWRTRNDCNFRRETKLRNSSIDYFNDFENREDRGALLENYVCSVLDRKWKNDVHFWRTKDKSEVDFIAQNENGAIIPIEIKATKLKKRENYARV